MEDRVFTTPNASIVLDGASQPYPLERSGGWIATQLGLRLVAGLEADPLRDLVDLLDEANNDLIRTFDLRPRNAPSTTVNIVRNSGDTIDVLVLCDSPVVILDKSSKIRPICDNRLQEATANLTRPLNERNLVAQAWQEYYQEVERLRNSENGFWCISASKESPRHAICTSIPTTEVAASLATTDGISVGVDRYQSPRGWLEATKLASTSLIDLINAVHEAEQSDIACTRWKRSKVHDDKTVVVSRPTSNPDI